MEFVQLGRGGVRVPRLAFGCGPMGVHDYGEVDLNEISRAVDLAIDHELNFFDTADVYGLGLAETFLGKKMIGRREKFFVATKFGVRISKKRAKQIDCSREWMKRALSSSLKRLQTDYIDLYQVHYPDRSTSLEELVEALEEERCAGRIRYYGLSNFGFDSFEHLSASESLVSFQLEHSLTRQEQVSKLREVTLLTGLTLLGYGVLGQGFLSGKYLQDAAFRSDDRRSRVEYDNFHGTKLAENLATVERLRIVSAHTGFTLPQLAIRWALDSVPNSVAIVGIKNSAQLIDNLGVFDSDYPCGHISDIVSQAVM